MGRSTSGMFVLLALSTLDYLSWAVARIKSVDAAAKAVLNILNYYKFYLFIDQNRKQQPSCGVCVCS